MALMVVSAILFFSISCVLVTCFRIPGFGGSSGMHGSPGLTGFPGIAPPTCQTIQSKHCAKYGFNVTTFPNYLGHTSVEIADINLGTILEQIKFCTIERTRSQLIACAIHVPICIEGKKIPPCLEDCKEVITTCKVNQLPGLHMAETLCGIFPSKVTAGNGGCISMP
ncbi:frizzled-4-like [Mytilus trossulus]|uniref:frizzled-4-like n=1 Tax=Mytilus trossulus TaxID=6551 RepID=UPI003004B105